MGYLFETEEHATLREQVRRFAQANRAVRAGWEEAEEFPIELYRTRRPRWASPASATPRSSAARAAISATSSWRPRRWCSTGTSVGTCVGLGSHGIALPPIVRLRHARRRSERFVRPVLAGEKIAALAITEPGGGSDVAALRTRAVRDGDHYVVNGAKTFITSGCRADFVTTAVRTGGAGHGGISLLVIERGTPGFTVSQEARQDRAGGRATPRSCAFEDCRVPAANLDRRGERRVPRDHDELRHRAARSSRASAWRSPSSPTASRSRTRASARRSARRSPASRSPATSSPTWRRASPPRAR